MGGGTNKGGPGRPPNEFKRQMAELADRGAQAAAAKGVLDDPTHPQWMNAWKFCAEQAHGRAHQAVDVTTAGEPLEVQVVVIGGREIRF